jgi:polyribonucleotide nucleotidyltransferase
LFDHVIRQDIQVVVSVLALGDEDPDVLGVIGTSLALATSDIPWRGPVGACRIGRRKHDGEILINPSYQDRAEGALDFEVLSCGKNNYINMIEATAHEVSEPDMVAVLQASGSLHTQLEQWQRDIVAQVGTSKRRTVNPTIPTDLFDLYTNEFKQKLFATIFSKQAGKKHINACKKEFVLAAGDLAVDVSLANSWFEQKIDEVLHEGTLGQSLRADGRDVDTVRPLYAQAGGVSAALHGSGIFYRGGTHVFSALTLGGPDEALQLDTIEARDSKKRFMHHYNFPPYSVGETGRVGGFNRRMTGHGALAEKALLPVMPDQTDFPYTIRLVSETMSSNGSSSMASVCASSLALMDGGVPIVRPVAGIAIGLMTNGDDYTILTDIQGPEDEYGDMDLKVAGTTNGITAIQMDVKVDGIPTHILTEALEKARVARLHILDTINAELPHPRAELSSRAPYIRSLSILPKHIGLVIGSNGKTIKKITEKTGVTDITIEDDGSVFISGDKTATQKALEHIQTLTRVYRVGEELNVTIVKLTKFGAFAKLDEHHEGLIHISEIAPYRIEKTSDVLVVGEEVHVVISQIENEKIGLSIKAIQPDFAASKGVQPPQ